MDPKTWRWATWKWKNWKWKTWKWKTWKWKWICWQVLVPILGPIVISALVVLAWQSGNPSFKADWSVVLDVTPWALTFYTVTLIGSTMNDLWPKLGNHKGLGSSLMMVAFSVTLYASLIVIWRHDASFIPGRSVYMVTFILLGISVVLCHRASEV
jgi:hypothetical protein